MSSFCTAKATHIFFSKKIQLICVSFDVNFNESLTNDVVSFEQHGPGIVCSLCDLVPTRCGTFYTPPHDSVGILWFYVGRPCVCPC